MSHTFKDPVRDRQTETTPHEQVPSSPAPAHRPPVVSAAPEGASQGGVLEWFRSMFSAPQAAQDSERSEVTATDSSPKWEAEEYGEVNPDYVTTKPDENSPLFPLVQDYSMEGPGQSPVFETHSFMPREAVDNEGTGHLHSFIGLRFTQLDPVTARYTRKRLKVGFGGGGRAIAEQGTLMNDYSTQADMSSETPITRDQLELLMDAIPKKAQEPYHVLNHNCNHFTQFLAEMVGATVPAQLHDTVFGPYGAYRNLANAAGEDPQGQTRFFQGGGMGRGEGSQMSNDHGKEFLLSFQDVAKSAARWDGLPFLLYPSLKDAAGKTAQEAARLAAFWDVSPLQAATMPAEFSRTIQDATEAADDLIHLSLWKGHPRVNIAAMKVIALANRFHSTFFPEQRTLSHYSQQELDASLHQPIEVKQTSGAKTNRVDVSTMENGADNAQLFAFDRTHLLGAGDVFLQAMGLVPDSLIRRYGSPGGIPIVQCADLFSQLEPTLSGAVGIFIDSYVLPFLQSRENLTNAQLASIATLSILDTLVHTAEQLGSPLYGPLRAICNNTEDLAMQRDRDSLDNNEHEESQKILRRFTKEAYEPKNEQERQIKQSRKFIADTVNTMEALFAAKFAVARILAASASRQET